MASGGGSTGDEQRAQVDNDCDLTARHASEDPNVRSVQRRLAVLLTDDFLDFMTIANALRSTGFISEEQWTNIQEKETSGERRILLIQYVSDCQKSDNAAKLVEELVENMETEKEKGFPGKDADRVARMNSLLEKLGSPAEVLFRADGYLANSLLTDDERTTVTDARNRHVPYRVQFGDPYGNYAPLLKIDDATNWKAASGKEVLSENRAVKSERLSLTGDDLFRQTSLPQTVVNDQPESTTAKHEEQGSDQRTAEDGDGKLSSHLAGSQVSRETPSPFQANDDARVRSFSPTPAELEESLDASDIGKVAVQAVLTILRTDLCNALENILPSIFWHTRQRNSLYCRRLYKEHARCADWRDVEADVITPFATDTFNYVGRYVDYVLAQCSEGGLVAFAGLLTEINYPELASRIVFRLIENMVELQADKTVSGSEYRQRVVLHHLIHHYSISEKSDFWSMFFRYHFAKEGSKFRYQLPATFLDPDGGRNESLVTGMEEISCNVRLFSLTRNITKGLGQAVALYCFDSETYRISSVTFSDLNEQVERLSNVLQRILNPIRTGSRRVLIQLPQSYVELVVSIMACADCGVLFWPVSVSASETDLHEKIKQSEPKLVIALGQRCIIHPQLKWFRASRCDLSTLYRPLYFQ